MVLPKAFFLLSGSFLGSLSVFFFFCDFGYVGAADDGKRLDLQSPAWDRCFFSLCFSVP